MCMHVTYIKRKNASLLSKCYKVVYYILGFHVTS